MRIFTLIALLFVGLQVMAQSYSLTIFNNGGQQFFVIMNGIKQNSLPLTNVKIGSLSQGSYEVKLIFADGKTADINKKIYLEEPGDYLARVTFKKGKGKLQYFGTTGGGTQAPGGSTNVIYRPSEQAVYSDQPVVQTPTAPVTSTPNQGSVGTTATVTSSQTPNSAATSTTVQGSSTSMSSSTTATTSGNGQTGGINMDVNMTDPSNTGNGGVGSTTTVVDPVTGETIQMNVGISMSGVDPNNPGIDTQTSTTSTSSSSQTPNSAGTTTTVQGSSTAMSSSTTATTSGNAQTGGINMNVNMTDPSNTGNGGVGSTTTVVDPVTGETIQMNVGISMSGMDPNNSGMNTQTTTTTTSSSSSTSTSTTTTNVQQNVNISTSGTQTPSTPPAPKQPMSVTCSEMFTSTTYVDELKRMTFDEDRLTSIQSTLKTKCLTSGQAYKVLETLTFSGDRLEMAKFMYMRLTDPINAMTLSELFTFDSEKEEFETFVKQNKR